jgi:hypothetical protein
LNGFYDACGVGWILGIEWAVVVLRDRGGIFVIGMGVEGRVIWHGLECFFPDGLVV